MSKQSPMVVVATKSPQALTGYDLVHVKTKKGAYITNASLTTHRSPLDGTLIACKGTARGDGMETAFLAKSAQSVANPIKRADDCLGVKCHGCDTTLAMPYDQAVASKEKHVHCVVCGSGIQYHTKGVDTAKGKGVSRHGNRNKKYTASWIQSELKAAGGCSVPVSSMRDMHKSMKDDEEMMSPYTDGTYSMLHNGKTVSFKKMGAMKDDDMIDIQAARRGKRKKVSPSKKKAMLRDRMKKDKMRMEEMSEKEVLVAVNGVRKAINAARKNGEAKIPIMALGTALVSEEASAQKLHRPFRNNEFTLSMNGMEHAKASEIALKLPQITRMFSAEKRGMKKWLSSPANQKELGKILKSKDFKILVKQFKGASSDSMSKDEQEKLVYEFLVKTGKVKSGHASKTTKVMITVVAAVAVIVGGMLLPAGLIALPAINFTAVMPYIGIVLGLGSRAARFFRSSESTSQRGIHDEAGSG